MALYLYDSKEYISASELCSLLTECAERILLGSIAVTADAPPRGYLKLSPQLSIGMIKLLVAATDKGTPSLIEINFGEKRLSVRAKAAAINGSETLAKICKTAALAGFKLLKSEDGIELFAEVDARPSLSVYAISISKLRELLLGSFYE